MIPQRIPLQALVGDVVTATVKRGYVTVMVMASGRRLVILDTPGRHDVYGFIPTPYDGVKP